MRGALPPAASLIFGSFNIACRIDRSKFAAARARSCRVTINQPKDLLLWRGYKSLDADIDGVARGMVPAPRVEGHDMRCRGRKPTGQYASQRSIRLPRRPERNRSAGMQIP